MNFPVVLKKPDTVEPSAKIHYEVASNGLFQVRKTVFYRVVTRTEGPIPGLLPEKERLELRCPRLPAALLEKVLAFFLEVYRVHRGEAVVILFYDPESQRFRVGVPPQTIPGYFRVDGRWQPLYRLNYEGVKSPPGFLRLGTIHSHGDMHAYSSSVDCDDERYEDGLHIVFGNLDRPVLSRSAAFAANGVRFPLDPDAVLEPASARASTARPDWMARVKRGEWWNSAKRVTASAYPVVSTTSVHAHDGGNRNGKEDGELY
jgi:hypothetical protein